MRMNDDAPPQHQQQHVAPHLLPRLAQRSFCERAVISLCVSQEGRHNNISNRVLSKGFCIGHF